MTKKTDSSPIPRRSAPKGGESPFERVNITLGKSTLSSIANIAANRSDFLDQAAWEKIARDYPEEYARAFAAGTAPKISL